MEEGTKGRRDEGTKGGAGLATSSAGGAYAVRRATADDVAAILAISNRAALETAANFAIEPERLDSWLRSFEETSGRYPWLVAVEPGATPPVIGFAKASPWKGRCAYVYSAEVTVYVDPGHHGRGVGRSLYAALIPTLAEAGFHTLIGGITLPNPASVRLHESFGFRRVALFEQVGWKFDRWHDVGYWQLILGRKTSKSQNAETDLAGS